MCYFTSIMLYLFGSKSTELSYHYVTLCTIAKPGNVIEPPVENEIDKTFPMCFFLSFDSLNIYLLQRISFAHFRFKFVKCTDQFNKQILTSLFYLIFFYTLYRMFQSSSNSHVCSSSL